MSADESGGLGQRLARNTLHAATGRLAAVLVWVLFTPPILRALGAEGFAVWALFFALTGYFAALDFGFVQGTLRHVAAARERGAHDEAGAFVTLGMLGFLSLGIVWMALAVLLRASLLAWLHIPASQSAAAGFAILAGALVFTFAGCANVVLATFQGYDRFGLANLVSLLVTLQQAVGILVVLRRGWGLWGLVANVGVGWVFGFLLALVMLARMVPEFRWRGARSSLVHAREALAFGGPMQLASLMAVVHAQADKFLLPVFVTLAAVTPYELGSRVLGSVMTFPQLLLLAMLPAAAALHAAGESGQLRKLYQRGDRYVLTVAAVALAVLIGSADRLCATWLGPGHADAALVLRGLSLAAGFVLATGMASVTARAVGRTDLEAWFGGISVVLHVVLSVLLLPRLGLRGTLVAVFVANLVGSSIFLLMVGRVLRWSAWDMLVRPHGVPLLATLAGVAVGVGLDRLLLAPGGFVAWMLLAVVAAAAGLVALGVAVATGYLRWREVRALLAPAPRRVGEPAESAP